ncbi:hypothetical protein AC249_AIPGENE25009, partial [Exaiptasia diaphana]
MYQLPIKPPQRNRSMFMERRPNFDRADEEKKPWAKTGAWFLGPKADNAAIFKDLVNDAIEKRSYYPCDPHFVTDEMREAESFKDAINKTKNELHN